jgi:hypothetical protein
MVANSSQNIKGFKENDTLFFSYKTVWMRAFLVMTASPGCGELRIHAHPTVSSIIPFSVPGHLHTEGTVGE